MLSRTLEYWEGLLDDASKLIESLRAELFESRAEIQKAIGEKESAESELLHAKLKWDQMRATVGFIIITTLCKIEGLALIACCLLWTCQRIFAHLPWQKDLTQHT